MTKKYKMHFVRRSNSYFYLFVGHYLRSKQSLTLVENKKSVKENKMQDIENRRMC